MISVLTPSMRKDGLEVINSCLLTERFSSRYRMEWIVCSPENWGFGDTWIENPPKKDADLYALNKAFNSMFRMAQGNLAVVVCDHTWFPQGTMSKLWSHFLAQPQRCVRGTGNQFERYGSKFYPVDMCWKDPVPEGRCENICYQINPWLAEFRLISLPMKGVRECGGIDEVYDEVAGYSEKEMAVRMAALGYQFFLDEAIEYRFVRHEPHGEVWDKRSRDAALLALNHVEALKAGTRNPRLTYL